MPRGIGDRRSVLAGDGSGPGLGRQRWLKVERRQLVPQHLDLFRKPVELLRRDPHVAQLLLGGSQPMKRVEELVRLVRVFIGEQLSQRLVTSIVFRYLVSQGRHARRDRHGPQEMGPLRSECHTRNVPPVGPDDITLRHLAGRQGLFVARGRSIGRLRAGRTRYTASSLRAMARKSGLPGGGVPPSLSGSRGRRRPAQNGCRPGGGHRGTPSDRGPAAGHPEGRPRSCDAMLPGD